METFKKSKGITDVIKLDLICRYKISAKQLFIDTFFVEMVALGYKQKQNM